MKYGFTGFVGVGIIAIAVSGCGGATSRPTIAAHPLFASGSAHGITLTLRIPDDTYPSDALVRAQVKIHNVTNHLISAPGTSCTQNDPWVEDLSASGRVLYPAGVRWIDLIPDCGATTEDLFLGAGNTITRTVFVVAKEPTLRAVMTFRRGAIQLVKAKTSPLHLRLTAREAPLVSIRTTPKVSVRLQPRGAVRGQLTYMSADHCHRGSAQYDYTGLYWTEASGRTITPECDQPLSLRVIAGWVGSSVARIDYKRR